MAVSIDGYIAKSDGDSEWVSDVDSVVFNKKIQEFGCIIIGRRTFDQFHPGIYPVKGVTNIVITTDDSRKSEWENVIFINKTPKEIIKLAEDKCHDKVLIIGGGTINGMFLKEDLIDEIFIDVHPLILGKGIKIFENVEVFKNLELLETKHLDGGLILLHYNVVK